MCLARHDSLSSSPSAPKLPWARSLGTQRITFPSSPADASSSPGRSAGGRRRLTEHSPLGAQRTTLTAWLCLESVDRYSTFLSGPSSSTFHRRTWLSPPAVARRALPPGSKWAEYMGAFWSCQLMIRGEAFIATLRREASMELHGSKASQRWDCNNDGIEEDDAIEARAGIIRRGNVAADAASRW